MSLGKYLTNIGVISSALGALSTLRQTEAMPKDWRRIVVWGIWLASLALAIGSVANQAKDQQFEEDQAQAVETEKAHQKVAKAARKQK